MLPRRAWASLVVVIGSLGALPASAQVPASPPPGAPATVPTTTKVTSTATPPGTVERARQGVVVLERQGKPLALGAVLDGDGRILSALSPLASGNFISARYHDGTVAPVKLVHSDRGWDLALLSPSATDKPIKKNGLRAGKQPSFVGLQTFALTMAPNTIGAQPAALKLAPGMLGGDSKALGESYELGARPAYVGGPIVNGAGEVVALVARACAAGAGIGCVPAPYGVPVSALKQFLKSVPAEALWLGVEAVGDEAGRVRGVRVSAVVPDSPAAVAGLRPGSSAAQADLIVAVDGTPVASLVELNEAVRSRTAGDSIELLLFGAGRYRHVSVRPRPAPELVKPPYVAPKPTKPRTPNPYR